MSSSKWGEPYSDNPYAPQIPHWLYFAEKANYAGFLIGSIIYGMVFVQFYRCLEAFFRTAGHKKRGGYDWALLAYVGALFSFGTVYTATNINLQLVTYVNNRDFPGNDDFPPGPLGYRWFIHASAASIVPNFMFMLGNWLADGLLIYRCFFIYSSNYAVIALPSLVLLSSFATGLWFIYQTAQPNGSWSFFLFPGSRIGLPYFSISSGLNVLLSVMILARLALRTRSNHDGMTKPSRPSGLWNTSVAVLIESGGLYAINSILFILPWGAKSYAANIFLPILAQVQVIVPFLIVLQALSKTALERKEAASGNSSTGRFGSQGRSGGNSLPTGYSASTVNLHGSGRQHHVKLGIGVETTVDMHHDKV